jgi:hypothetical protein
MQKGRTGGLFPLVAKAAVQRATTRTSSSTLFE